MHYADILCLGRNNRDKSVVIKPRRVFEAIKKHLCAHRYTHVYTVHVYIYIQKISRSREISFFFSFFLSKIRGNHHLLCVCASLIADQLPGLSDLPTSLSVNILVPMLSVNILIHLQRADQVGQVYRNVYVNAV